MPSYDYERVPSELNGSSASAEQSKLASCISVTASSSRSGTSQRAWRARWVSIAARPAPGTGIRAPVFGALRDRLDCSRPRQVLRVPCRPGPPSYASRRAPSWRASATHAQQADAHCTDPTGWRPRTPSIGNKQCRTWWSSSAGSSWWSCSSATTRRHLQRRGRRTSAR